MIEVSLSNIKLSQKLDALLRNYDIAGHVKLSLYGLDNEWLASGETVPFVRRKGIIYWDVPMKEVRIRDLVNTFYMNHGCNVTLEIEETQYWEDNRYEIPGVTELFIRYWKECKKRWKPWGNYVSEKALEKLIKKSGVFPRDVLRAIWLQNFYSIPEFSRMFSVSKRSAKNILIACGYWKKKCETEYMLYSERQDEILKCLEKAKISYNELGMCARYGNRIRIQVAHGINCISNALESLSSKLTFQSSSHIQWNEPAYGERKRVAETIFIAILVLGMLIFTVIGLGLFGYHVSEGYTGSVESIYGFWSSIIGSLIAGLVTILTTYFIIHRSYKLDYHNERIAVLPFFQAKVIENHFSIGDKEPDFVKNISKENICLCHDFCEDSILIEITNVGHDIAFMVSVAGAWGDYENYVFQSVYVNEKVYLVIEAYDRLELVLEYHDLYGNLYYQKFVRSEKDISGGYIGFESAPPELVNRTKRTRYCQ